MDNEHVVEQSDHEGTTSKGAPVIQFDNVHFSYTGNADDEALRGVTFSIAAGEHVCILGGNGSGKSTCAQLMNALLLPTGGSVRTLDIDVAAESGRALELRQQVAMVFQYPDDQMVTSIVADDVAFGPENLGVPHDQIVERVHDALEAVDMEVYAHKDPADLSGGQRQRVAVAGALAMHPCILVLDEPAAMLDPAGRRSIQDIVRHLREQGITIVHITHFMDDALMADRVIVLDQGTVAVSGTPAQVFSQRERLRALGLEPPFTLQLADEIAPALAQAGHAIAEESDVLRADDLADAIVEAARDNVVGSLDASGPGGAQVDGLGTNLDTPQEKVADPSRTTNASNPTRVNEHGAAPLTPHPSLSTTDPAIVFEHASFSYADERNPHKRSGLLKQLGTRLRRRTPRAADTLSDLSFSLPKGSLTALIGSTGAGKSTTVELACALKLPNAGTVRVGGITTDDLERRPDLRALVGFVAQLPERQLFAQTVYDDVAFGPRNLHLSDEEVDQRVRASISFTGLEPTSELLERSPFALSGGQQRCIALAGVLALRTPMLILDEPMAGLDPTARHRMRALVRELKEQGTTLLVVTHDMNDVADLADYVVALDHGACVAQGTPAQVFAEHADQLPGIPDARAFARLLEARGLTLPHEPLTLADLTQEVNDVLAHAHR